MTSLFIDSNTAIEGDFYAIPQKIEFSSVKLRQAMILNNVYNVVDFVVSVTIPTQSFAQSFSIPDGVYTGTTLASTLQTLINAEFVDNNFAVTYSVSTRKFTFSYTNLTATVTVFMSFNLESQAFFGTNTFILSTDNITTTDSFTGYQSISEPGFYRIESPTLANFSFMEHDAANSGLIGVVPITSGPGEYSIYDNPDNFLMTSSGLNDIYNYIQIKIFVGDSQRQIESPKFGLVLQFQ